MSIASSTIFLSWSPDQPVTKVMSILVKRRGHSFYCSPSTSTSSDLSGCLNYFRMRSAVNPVQLPRAPSSISVGRMASSSPKIGGSSMLTLCPEPDSMSNLTLLPVQRATAVAIGRTLSDVLAGEQDRGQRESDGCQPGQDDDRRQLVRLVDAGQSLMAQVAEHRLRVVPDGDGGRALADTRDPRFPDHHVTQPEDQCVPDT